MLEELYFFVITIYVLFCLSFPELNLVLFLLIGKVTYEPRLGFFDLISLNYINAVILLIHTVWTIKSKTIKQRFKIDFLTLHLLFIVWICISFLFFTTNYDYALDKILVLVFVSFVSSIFFVVRLQYVGKKVVRDFVLFFALVGIGMGSVGLTIFLQGIANQRIAILGGGPIVLARIIGSTILILFVFYSELTKKYSRVIIWAILSILFLSQISTLSKGPLLSLVTTLGISFIFLHKNQLRFRNIFYVLFTIGVILSIMFAFDISERYFLNPYDDISKGSYGTRFQHIVNAREVFKTHPIVGIGLGDFIQFGDGHKYPHNIFLEILSELGIIGILLILGIISQFSFILYKFTNSYRKPNSKFTKYLKILILLSIYMFLNQQVSGDLMDSRFMWFYIIASSVYFHFESDIAEN